MSHQKNVYGAIKKYNARTFPVHAWQGYKKEENMNKKTLIGFSN